MQLLPLQQLEKPKKDHYFEETNYCNVIVNTEIKNEKIHMNISMMLIPSNNFITRVLRQFPLFLASICEFRDFYGIDVFDRLCGLETVSIETYALPLASFVSFLQTATVTHVCISTNFPFLFQVIKKNPELNLTLNVTNQKELELQLEIIATHPNQNNIKNITIVYSY